MIKNIILLILAFIVPYLIGIVVVIVFEYFQKKRYMNEFYSFVFSADDSGIYLGNGLFKEVVENVEVQRDMYGRISSIVLNLKNNTHDHVSDITHIPKKIR